MRASCRDGRQHEMYDLKITSNPHKTQQFLFRLQNIACHAGVPYLKNPTMHIYKALTISKCVVLRLFLSQNVIICYSIPYLGGVLRTLPAHLASWGHTCGSVGAMGFVCDASLQDALAASVKHHQGRTDTRNNVYLGCRFQFFWCLIRKKKMWPAVLQALPLYH